jgi:Ca2+-binding RTX toxin-like protein
MDGNFFVATNEIFIGNSSGTTINAYGGNDVLVGNGGDDTLNGGSGNDTYVFGLNDGDDTINETSGTDRILIASGAAALTSLNAYDNDTDANSGDLVIQFNGQEIVINNQYGSDADLKVESISFDGASISGYDLGTGSYLINGADPANSGGARVVNLSGTSTDNFIAGETGSVDNITGGSGRDLIFGGGQNDTLSGGAGNDFLNGGAGNDTLNGGADNDTLVGGSGNDTLTGGSGADRFVFAETGSANRDTILDFSNAEGDVLDFSALLGAATGAAASGSNINDYVKLTQSGANILVQVDVNGTAGGAQWADVATLQGYGTSAADIVKIAFQGQDHQLSA